MPIGHGVQEAWPSRAYVPAGQMVHSGELISELNLPGRHLAHLPGEVWKGKSSPQPAMRKPGLHALQVCSSCTQSVSWQNRFMLLPSLCGGSFANLMRLTALKYWPVVFSGNGHALHMPGESKEQLTRYKPTGHEAHGNIAQPVLDVKPWLVK
jgi:hypothetical protein